MIIRNNAVLIAGVFVAGMSTAFANADHDDHVIQVVEPGLMNDFDGYSVGNDEPGGWHVTSRTLRGEEIFQPGVAEENGNKYLKAIAVGAGDLEDPQNDSKANKRFAFFNKSETWIGDFSNIGAISGDIKVFSSSEDIKLRLNFESGDGNFYLSKDAFAFSTADSWASFSFDLKAEDFVVVDANGFDGWERSGLDTVAAESDFAEAIKDIHEWKFVSNGTPIWGNADVLEAVVGFDNLTASAVSAVPVPGAAWLMISGLIGLGSFSSKKQRKA